VTSFFGINLCVFLENNKTDLHQIFLGSRRKHLFITTCIEKHRLHPVFNARLLVLEFEFCQIKLRLNHR